MDDDGSASRKFVESNIDDILAHGSRVVRRDENGDGTGGLGSVSYSKMTFASAGSDTTIDINDPDFWRKVLSSKESQQMITVDDLSKQFMDAITSQSMRSRNEFFDKVKEKVRQTMVAIGAGDTVGELSELVSLLRTVLSSPKFREGIDIVVAALDRLAIVTVEAALPSPKRSSSKW